ncbi:hypothetical protein QFC22_003043 [Naganishia vaughanmartiniae]|uniref:Uncharacterized protein n=1 Tax=Naganishia vaughanmartiniae TaxID=1424756 RepID=A0ACC2X7V9_9TREE|nr:hypothetical protein QFC22_003043 [Naganishia vaughanmartiniae]
MAEEDVDWGMDDDFDPWQPADEQAVISNPTSHPSTGMNDGNIAMQNGDSQSGGSTAMEGMMEVQQRFRNQDVHLPVGWTLRTSRHDIAKQYFYNPYTREAMWSPPGEMVFDESGIVTPPLPQFQQGPGSNLQMRTSGRLTDHMKMAPIHDTPIVIPSAGIAHMDTSAPAVTPTTTSTPTSPAKLRLIDRIQSARYVPQEKRETASPFVSSEPVTLIPAAASDARPGSHASEAGGVRDITRQGDSYRPQYREPTPPVAQPPVGPADSRNNEEVFASRRYTEKLPEWLEANNPKLDSGDSSLRRARDDNDNSSRSASVKRVKVEEDTPSKPAVATSTDISEDSKSVIRDAYSARNRNGVDSKPSSSALRSKVPDNPNSRKATPLADRLQPRSATAASSVPTVPGNSTPHQQARSTEPARTGASRQTANGQRGPNGKNDNPKIDDRLQPAAYSTSEDRKSQLSSAGRPGENRHSKASQKNQGAIPPAPRSKPSGANNAPIVANRWSQNASTRVGDVQDSKPAPAVEQVRQTTINESNRSTDSRTGPGASPSVTAHIQRQNNHGGDFNSDKGPDRTWPSTDTPDNHKHSVSIPQSSPRQTPSQSELNAQQAYARAVPRMADNRPSGPSLDRSSNLPPARTHPSDQYTPNSAARNAWNGDGRSSSTSNFPPSDQNMSARSTKESMPSSMASGFRRSDPPYISNPRARTPPSAAPVRTRSPAPHLPPPSWSQTHERRSPPRQVPGSARRRSPSPHRLPPVASRYPAPRFEDRPPRTPDAYVPGPNPRDESKPHPRAPDLYTPGGHSPPRQQPRGLDVYDARADPRGPRFDTRGPPPARGPPGRR